MTDAVELAHRFADEIPGAVLIDQFNSPANPALHRGATSLEIIEDADGPIDVFVAAVGTGGTLTGVGEPQRTVL